MASRLFSPPRLLLPNPSRDRHTTWLETFYDLVFAVAVAALGSRLDHNTSPLGILQFLGLFLPVWWAWLGHTVYNTRFDTDDLFQRLCTFGIMLAATGMAIEIPYAFEGAAVGFAISYLGARVSLLILYIRAWYHVAETRTITTRYLIGFGLGASLWAISLLTPAPARYILWTAGLGIDLATPWLIRPVLRRAPVDTSHLPERLGLFTIIVLGEIITSFVGALSGRVELPELLAAALAFCVTASIWWVYFTYLEVAPFTDSLGSGQTYIYLHLPIVIGLSIIAVGLAHAVDQAVEPVLSLETRWLLGVGLTLWLTASFGLKLTSIHERLEAKVFALYAAIIATIALIMFLGSYLSSLLTLALLVLFLLIFVALDVRYWKVWSEHAEPEPGLQGKDDRI